jgi:hypothetical protein
MLRDFRHIQTHTISVILIESMNQVRRAIRATLPPLPKENSRKWASIPHGHQG